MVQITEARKNIASILRRVVTHGERVVLTRHGRKTALIVPATESRDGQVDATVCAFAQRLGLARPSVETVILFGSRARGDFRPDSDIDIMVIEDKLPIRKFWTEWNALNSAASQAGLNADVVLVRQAEWLTYKQRPSSVYSKAAKEGKVIYARA